MNLRALGILFFLPVPLVLWLFTNLPLRPLPSLGIGLLLMLTHPLYARPWVMGNAGSSCLWCGRGTVSGTEASALSVQDPRGSGVFQHCSTEHRDASSRTLAFAWRFRDGLRIGVLGSLLVLVVVLVGTSQHLFRALTPEDGVAVFRLGVAVAVLPLGWLGPRKSSRVAAETPARAPFPIHIAGTIGISSVLWLFRLIGLLWLAQGVRHFALRG